MTGEHIGVKTLSARFRLHIVVGAELPAGPYFVNDILFEVNIADPMGPSLAAVVQIAEGELIEIKDVPAGTDPLRHEDHFATESAQPLLRRAVGGKSGILRRAVAAEAVCTGEQPLRQPGGKPLVELFVFPVEQIAPVGVEIFTEPLRFLLEQRRASFVPGRSPGDDVEQDTDVAFVRLVDEAFQSLPLSHRILFSGQPCADGVDSEVAVAVTAVDGGSEPESVDSQLSEVVEQRRQSFDGAVGGGGINPRFDENQTFDPFRGFGAAVGALLHAHFRIRSVLRQQRRVVDFSAVQAQSDGEEGKRKEKIFQDEISRDVTESGIRRGRPSESRRRRSVVLVRVFFHS